MTERNKGLTKFAGGLAGSVGLSALGQAAMGIGIGITCPPLIGALALGSGVALVGGIAGGAKGVKNVKNAKTKQEYIMEQNPNIDFQKFADLLSRYKEKEARNSMLIIKHKYL